MPDNPQPDDEPLGDPLMEDRILELAEIGRRMYERCDTLVGALKGIEDDARHLRATVKALRRLLPKPLPKPPDDAR